jgi:hypothetical protein
MSKYIDSYLYWKCIVIVTQGHKFQNKFNGGFRGMQWGDRTPLRENFFDFPPQNQTKNKFILLQMYLKNLFFAYDHIPFQNPRYVTEQMIYSFFLNYNVKRIHILLK